MKKYNMTMIPLLCAAAAPLCADAQGSKPTTAKPSDQQMMMNQNQITPSAEPNVTRWADPYITADFIWWKVQEDGLEYAFNGVGNGITNAGKGSMHTPHFKYEPGFKVGFGLKFRHDGWDLYSQYTWLHAKGSDSVTSRDNSNVVSNIFIPDVANSSNLDTFPLTSASANWQMHLNVLDLELGRNFWISKWLTLRPHYGMKFSWINQRFNTNYYGATGFNAQFDNYQQRMKLNESSVGLRTGLDTAWYMWKKWCVFGEFAVSGLWNDFNSKRKDSGSLTGSTSGILLDNIRKSPHSVTAVLEWALGLRFETAFHNDDYDFMLQAGWEEQLWFSQNQFVMMPNQTPANLNFEGFTFKAAFYF